MSSNRKPFSFPAPLASFLSFGLLILVWFFVTRKQDFNHSVLPRLDDFIRTSLQEFRSGRLLTDALASLFRWSSGFFLSLILAVPCGLFLGKSPWTRRVLLTYLNLFRSLSPLAWIPFAVLWFGIGDPPVIFLIFLGSFFPLTFSTINSVLKLPKFYDQLARDFQYFGVEYLRDLLFPAILPQLVAALRLTAGLGWIILVPAEMLAGSEGLGYAILDARNGMRTDLLILNMLAIALIAHTLDVALEKLNRLSSVRWGHEQ